jgi:lysophospholipase L1-like esterase
MAAANVHRLRPRARGGSAPAWPPYGYATVGLIVLLVIAVPLAPSSRVRWAVRVTLTIAGLAAVAAEAAWQFPSPVELSADTTVVVVGDSLSAGPEAWPATFARMSGCRLDNRAAAGARVSGAATQLRTPTQTPCLLIFALGGNDLLGGMAPDAFARDLEAATALSRTSACQVVMLALPIYPFQNGYGRAQREVARDHGMTLLPRSVLARALTWPGNTTDGLHLSAQGHDHLGRAIAGRITCRP